MTANLSSALICMFNDAEQHLSDDTLELLVRLCDEGACAGMQAENQSETLGVLAMMLASGEKSSLPSNEVLSYVLWGLSEQASSIGAMIHVASNATYQLEKRKAERACGQNAEGLA